MRGQLLGEAAGRDEDNILTFVHDLFTTPKTPQNTGNSLQSEGRLRFAQASTGAHTNAC